MYKSKGVNNYDTITKMGKYFKESKTTKRQSTYKMLQN